MFIIESKYITFVLRKNKQLIIFTMNIIDFRKPTLLNSFVREIRDISIRTID